MSRACRTDLGRNSRVGSAKEINDSMIPHDVTRKQWVRAADSRTRRLQLIYPGPSLMNEDSAARSAHRDLPAMDDAGLYRERRLAQWRLDLELRPDAWLVARVEAINAEIRRRRPLPDRSQAAAPRRARLGVDWRGDVL
jgi:hypothetical protein